MVEKYEDCISRQAVLNLLPELNVTMGECGLADEIKKLSSVQPHKRGHWIDIWDKEDGTNESAICSECEKHSMRPVGNFCKWCGADMRGEENE